MNSEHEDVLEMACEILRKENEALMADKKLLVDIINVKDGEIKRLRGLLQAAKCPNCNGSGARPIRVAFKGVELEQCQWCDEKKQALEETSK